MWVTFDCYGTLIDWDTGIRQAFMTLLSEKQAPVDLNAFHARWEEIQFDWIQREYQPYKEILKVSLRDALNEFGLPYADEDGARFAATMPTWTPFPDVKPALTELKKHAKLAIISNTDSDILQSSVALMEVEFDELVTAEDNRLYKPNPRVFELAMQRLGCTPREMWHVAFGFKYDILPAQSVGCRTVWVNRAGEPRPAGATPDFEVRGLEEIARCIFP
ncbi:MAG: haloacid dehalogenase type II [Abditibacteriales bacterium]|nr:haloacid dehalogenase type II [Abditibacteriales bacterium]MDW8365133.1 haloacid dehalogenase type II [Abditibacteriales bacterium]